MPRRRSRSRKNKKRIICLYCGSNQHIPRGYDRRGKSHECLRRGVGVGVHSERRSWQRKMGLKIEPKYVSPCPRLGTRARNVN